MWGLWFELNEASKPFILNFWQLKYSYKVVKKWCCFVTVEWLELFQRINCWTCHIVNDIWKIIFPMQKIVMREATYKVFAIEGSKRQHFPSLQISSWPVIHQNHPKDMILCRLNWNRLSQLCWRTHKACLHVFKSAQSCLEWKSTVHENNRHETVTSSHAFPFSCWTTGFLNITILYRIEQSSLKSVLHGVFAQLGHVENLVYVTVDLQFYQHNSPTNAYYS